MNRETLIERVQEFMQESGLSSEDFHISHGGAMLLEGLRETTGDVDISIHSQIMFDELSAENPYKPLVEAYDTVVMQWSLDVDLHVMDPDQVELTVNEDCIQYRSMHQTLLDKKELGRHKDLSDIEQLEQYVMYS